jgi:carbamoyl-phosphate synthase small subunit
MAKRKLVLENGKVFRGEGFGNPGKTIGEIVFHTAMVGYQEIMTDPTNHGRIMLMSYPLIGNYGFTEDDNQSLNVHISGLVVSEHNENPSNFRFTTTLGETMELNGTVGLSGIDTRALVKTLISSEKPLLAMIVDDEEDDEKCVEELKNTSCEYNPVKAVTCKRVLYMRTRNPQYTVVAVDCGVRTSLIKELNALSCNLVVVPYDTSAENIMKYKPDGIFFTNGPGSPYINTSLIELVKELKGKVPILGIGLGFHIICVAYGLEALRLSSGVAGSNIPVLELSSGKILITSQNHCFEISSKNVEKSNLEVTYKNVMTGGLEGIEDEANGVIAVQFEPNATGDGTGGEVLRKFIQLMIARGGAENAEENRY